MALQHLRSSTAHKRPIPTVMSAGQIAINTNEASPALFFKDSNGDLVKVGPVHIGTDAPNSSPASVAATALVTGTVYQILTVGDSDFTLVGASANTVGTIFTATGTTTGTGTVSGQQGVEKGEMWLDTTGGTYVLKIYDGTDWRSESGTFVDVSGDTMTGALLLDNAASASAPDLSFDGDANTGLYSPGADQVAIATGGNGRVFIDSSGRLGVGTSSPGALLTLQNGNTNNVSGSILQMNLGPNGYWHIEAANGISSSQRALRFINNNGSTSTTLATILQNGNVGVGTSSPGSLLTVEANTTSLGSGGFKIQTAGSNESFFTFGVSSSLGAAYITSSENGTGTNLPIYFNTGSGPTTAMCIDASQRVGIGTTSPGHALQVNGAICATGTFGTASASTLVLDVAGDARILTTGPNSSSYNPVLFAQVNSTGGGYAERARIDASGRLLVGTSSSSGAANNTSTVVAGNYKTRSGFQNLLNNTATTVHTFDGDSIAFYLVHAALAAVDTNNYAAVSVVAVQGSSAKISNLMTAGLLFITLSGNQLQLRQNAGGTAGVYWSITRTMLA